MKLGQFIEYNKFFCNRTQDVLEKLYSDPFLKNRNLSISLNQLLKILYSLILLYERLGAIEIY